MYSMSTIKIQSQIVLTAVLCSLMAGCEGDPDQKIPGEKMVDVYADVLIVTSAYEAGEEPPDYFEQLDSVFTEHNVDRDIFFTTLDYYREDPYRWKDLLDRVIAELERRRDQVLEPSNTRSSS